MANNKVEKRVNRGFGATLLIVLLVLVLVIAGFFLGSKLREQPANPPETPAASKTLTPGVDRLAAGTVLVGEPLRGFVVEEMNIVTESTADLNDRRTVSYAVPNAHYAPTQVAELKSLLSSQVRDWAEQYAAQVQNDGSDNELNISWEVSVASGQVLAERLTYYGFTGSAAPQTGHTTFYTDLDTGNAWPAAELLHPEIAQRLAARWQHEPPPGTAQIPELTAQDISDLTLLPDGTLQLAFTPGVLAPVDSGPVLLDFSPDAAAPLLSDIGLLLREKVVAGPLFGEPQDPTSSPPPEPEPAPEPEPEPEPTDEPEEEVSGPIVNPGVTHGVDCTATPCVALTFDDGPGKHTETLLDYLAEAQAHATFFVVGKNAQNRPDTLARIAAEGHEIGNHTMGHPDLTKLKTAPLDYEITTTDEIIRDITGLETVLARPPYGAENGWVLSELGLRNKATILWDVDTEDWDHRSTRKTVENTLANVKNGSIILMHDIHNSTVEAVPEIIRELQERGYTLVTVSELLAGTTPGEKYYRAP